MKKKNIIQILLTKQEELEEYYRELRKYEYDNNKPIKGIKTRKKLYKFLSLLLKINRMIQKQQLIILNDQSNNTDKPKIYAVTHVGRYDIEMAIEGVKESAFFLMGDPGSVYKSFDGVLLKANGTIFFDTDHKTDRNICKENCIKVLENGGNILMFPEGAWNITENEIVMQLYDGAVEMAIKTGADIVPIAIEQYGKKYCMNIGENISYDKTKEYNVKLEKRRLRDDLASLKWEIWEKYSERVIRKEMNSNAKEEYLESVMSETENGYTVDEINRTKFHDKNINPPEQVFEHLANINVNKKNIFLFKNINKIERERQAKLMIEKKVEDSLEEYYKTR